MKLIQLLLFGFVVALATSARADRISPVYAWEQTYHDAGFDSNTNVISWCSIYYWRDSYDLIGRAPEPQWKTCTCLIPNSILVSWDTTIGADVYVDDIATVEADVTVYGLLCCSVIIGPDSGNAPPLEIEAPGAGYSWHVPDPSLETCAVVFFDY